MRDAPPPAQSSDPTRAGDDSTAADEDFLFHLYRGTELLMEERMVEAKEELERALRRKPQDAKGQDLLAGVYFRLGVYPRAIEIYETLVDAYPKDVALRVNLALALLKTGQPAAALEHILLALELAPDHERAWGYLGLIHWRLARFAEARDAFLRGGQAAMARRMEEVLGPSATAEEARAVTDDDDSAGDYSAVRAAAEKAIEEFEAEVVPLRVADATPASVPPQPHAEWSAIEPGEERIPLRSAPPRAAPARRAPASGAAQLADLLEQWSLASLDQDVLAIAPRGDLLVRADNVMHARLEGLRALRGDLQTTVIHRRMRGRDLEHVLGGTDNPILRWRGPLSAVLAPPKGCAFVAIALASDLLYVRESLVWAFDDRLGYENGRLDVGGASAPIEMLQLYGQGTAVLALAGAPSAMHVAEGQEVHVVPDALVGWTGRLFPSGLRRGSQPYLSAAPPLGFRGTGVVLVS